MRRERHNKKGATYDNIFVVVFFFGFAIFMLMMSLLWTELTSATLVTQLWGKTATGTNIQANADDFFNDIDGWIVMIYIFIHLGVIILAFMLRSHPIMYIGGIFIILILVTVSYHLQQVWNDVYADPEFSSVQANLLFTNVLISNMVKIETIFSFLTLIVLGGLAKTEGFL